MTIEPSGTTTAELAAGAVTRAPQQGRSRASFERMVAAARQLMIERGNEDFTLQEVSERGNVSIGSIYLRFEGKDSLLHVVIADELDRLQNDEVEMIRGVLAASSDLKRFIELFVDRYYLVLRDHAPLLRPIMARAAFDPAVSAPGRAAASATLQASTSAILSYSKELDPRTANRRAAAAYQIIFATIARYLSLGSTTESAESDWDTLKDELAAMCIAYLKA